LADYGNFRVKNGLDVGIGASIIATSSDKNIGVGNTLPQYKLDVAGDINFTGSLYQNGTVFSGGGGGSGIGTQWITGSTGIHTLSNVGIGTLASPFEGTKLLISSGSDQFEFLPGAELRKNRIINTDRITPYGYIDQETIARSFYFSINNPSDNTLVITSSKRVGIGSLTPVQKLDVIGNGYFSGSLTASQFIGDGSGLTGIVATGSGIVIKDSGSSVGTASTVDFGANLNASLSGGTVTVNVAGIVSSITAGSGISVDQSTGNVTITATGGGSGGIGTAGGDGANIRSISGAHLVSYASQSDFSNSALSIAGVGAYRQVGILTGSTSIDLNDNFGNSVAVSADGNTIVVGAYQDEVSGTSDNGVVYVFDRTGNSFNQVGILTGSRAGDTSDQFGYSVAVSADGKTIIAGSPFDEGSGAANSSGTAYVFDRVGNTFTQVGILTGLYASTAGDNFGYSVATSANGNTIAVGAYQDETGATSDIGVVYVFDRVGDTFTRVGSLTGSYAINSSDGFGNSLVVSTDGKTIIVGAYQDETGGTSDTGVVYIFERQGNTFTQVASLTGSNSGAADQFGYSVAVSADGRKIIVGSPEDEITGHGSGSGIVYVFDRKGNTVTQVGILTGLYASTAGDNFGNSVATSADGNTIVVGALNDESPLSSNSSGLVYIFNRQGDSFSTVGIITGYYSGASNDNFGQSVAVSADGKTVIVGAWNDEYPGTSSSSGSVYVFDEVKETYLYSGPTGNIGIGTSNPQSKFEVFGNSRVIGNLDFTGNISKNGTTLNLLGINTVGTTTLNNLSITGVSTFSGISTFQSDAYVGGVLYANSFSVAGGTTFGNDIVTRNISASGLSTFSGISTFQSQIYVNGNLNYTGDLYKNGQIVNIPIGINTLGVTSFTHINASGIITAAQFNGNGIGVRNAQGTHYGDYAVLSEHASSANMLVGISTYRKVGIFTGSDPCLPLQFGYYVETNIDGSIVYASSLEENPGGNTYGNVFAFERVGIGTFKKIARITKRNRHTGDEFGIRIACSADGQTVAIASKSHNSVVGSGYVSVHERRGNSYVRLLEDATSTAGSSYFGNALCISGDSQLVYIGASGYPGGGGGEGLVKIYERSGDTYNVLQSINFSDQYGNPFNYGVGAQLASSYDGQTLYIGATSASNIYGNTGNGLVYVFNRIGIGSTYVLNGNLPYIATSNDAYAYAIDSLKCSADGNIVVVSSIYDDTGALSNNGTIYFYQRNTSMSLSSEDYRGGTESYTLLGTISGPTSSSNYGSNIKLSYDGRLCVFTSYSSSSRRRVHVVRIDHNPFPSVVEIANWTIDGYASINGSSYNLEFFEYAQSLSLSKDGKLLYIGSTAFPVGNSTGAVELRELTYSPNLYVHPLTGNIGIGTTNSETAKLKVSGTVNATAFVGDGSGLTGVTASGSGVIIRDDGSLVGTAATLDFGTNVAVSPLSAGIVTITAAAGFNTLGETKFNRLFISGITTLSSSSGSGLHISTNTFRVYDGLGTRYTNLQAPSNSSYGGSDAIVTLPSKTGELIVGNTSGSISQHINSTGIITASKFDASLPSSFSGAIVSGMLTAINATFSGNVSVAQSVTAASFYGDGSTLTGVVATGSGVEVRDDGTIVGTASTLNFGTNLTVTFSEGTATIDGGANSGVFNILNVSGVASAGIFRGDGSDLRHLSQTNLSAYSGRSKLSSNSFGIVGYGTYIQAGIFSGSSTIPIVNSAFGNDIKCSVDGRYLIVSTGHDGIQYNSSSSQSVSLIERCGNSFSAIGIVTAGPYRRHSQDFLCFGLKGSIDISDDGKTFVVGAASHTTPGMQSQSGAVYVYDHVGLGTTSGIKSVGIITSPNNYGSAEFGSTLKLSNNGKTLYVGAAEDFDGGRVYVFDRVGDTFNNVGIITGAYSVGGGSTSVDKFGHVVTASKDGKTVAVLAAEKARNTNSNQNNAILYIFNRLPNDTFRLVSSIHSFAFTPESAFISYTERMRGSKLCMSEDGSIIVLGSPINGYKGTAFVYGKNQNTNTYSLISSLPLTAAQSASDSRYFGFSVDCSPDGELVYITAPRKRNSSNYFVGEVVVYQRINNSYEIISEVSGSLTINENDFFGWSLAVSGDSTDLYVGSYLDELSGSATGLVYAYELSTETLVYTKTTGGKIGIGATNPQYKLDVLGDINLTGNLYRSGEVIALGSGSAGGGDYTSFSVYSSHSKTSDSSSSISGIETYRQVGILTGRRDISQSNEEFGKSVSVSADGSTIIVGAPGQELSGYNTDAGLAYVFDRDGGNRFRQVGILTAGNYGSDNAGRVVKISNDGLLALVGTANQPLSGPNIDAFSGSARLYKRTDKKTSSTFNLVGIFTGAFDSYDQMGTSLSMSADGKVVVIGAINDEVQSGIGVQNTGTVFVFDVNDTIFTRVGILTSGTVAEASDAFGHSVAINRDGKTIAVGSPYGSRLAGGDTGIVHIYDRIADSYVHVGILTHTYLSHGDRFGESLAISADGNTVIVGASNEYFYGSSNIGAAFVFDRYNVGVGTTSTTNFNLVGILTGSYAWNPSDLFGFAVDCSADGNTIIVGAHQDESYDEGGGSNNSAGIVYIFNRQGNNFKEVGILTAFYDAGQTYNEDNLGYSISISADGKTIAAGAIKEFNDITNTFDYKGAVYVYDQVRETYLYSGPSGNIGIGSEIPNYKLDVAGDINFTGSLYQNGTVFSGGGGGSVGAGGTWEVTSVGIHTLKNVGIRTTNPTSALTVSGDGLFTGVVTSTTFNGQINQTSGVSTFVSVLSSGIRVTGVATATRGFSGNLTGNVNATGISTFLNRVDVKNDDSSPSRIDFYTETGGTRYTRVQSATHASYSSNLTVTLPSVSGRLIVGDTATTISNNINSAGIITASSFSGKDNNLFTEWTLGASGNSDYTFTGPGFSGSELDPTLYLIRGRKYKFTNTMGAHPFRIQSTVNGSTGTQYNDGITNNDVSNGTLTWEVRFNTPSTLYYQCTSHGSMGGVIYILNATNLDSLIVSGVSTFSGITTVTGPTLFAKQLNVTGVITASKFVGDGSGLTGVVATGSGIVFQDEGSSIGTAATVNFVGDNVSASISDGTATITISGGGGGGSQGIQGIQGRQGIQGASIQGATGAQGAPGGGGGGESSQGLQGVQGITGAGIQGSQGISGSFVGQGIQGIQGLAGSGGLSESLAIAYSIAL